MMEHTPDDFVNNAERVAVIPDRELDVKLTGSSVSRGGAFEISFDNSLEFQA